MGKSSQLVILKNHVRLRKTESIIHELYPKNSPYVASIELVNRGSENLFIRNITIKSSDINIPDQAIYFDFQSNTFPIRIRKTKQLTYYINTQKLSQGKTHLSIQFQYYCKNKRVINMQQIQALIVISLKQFEEALLLAINPGNIKTYCSMFLKDWNKRLDLSDLRLAEKSDTSSIPTCIHYNPKTVGIGRMSSYNYRQGKLNSFCNFLWDVGIDSSHEKNNYWLTFQDDKPAKKITANQLFYDFFNELMQTVQRAVGYKFLNIAFSHPNCLPLPQLITLKKNINDLGFKDNHLYFIDDATAMLFNLMDEFPVNCYFLTYNLGLENIEINYFYVDFRNQKKILIERIDYDALKNFGRENIIEIIVDLICEKLLYLDDSLIIKNKFKQYDPSIEKYLKKNMSCIWAIAEECFNRFFYEDNFDVHSRLPQMYCENSNEKDMPIKKYIGNKVKFSVNEITSRIFDKINHSVRMVNNIFCNHSNKKENLNRYILLSGYSADIPLVQQLFDTYMSKKIPVFESNEIIEEPDTRNIIHFDPSDKIICEPNFLKRNIMCTSYFRKISFIYSLI